MRQAAFGRSHGRLLLMVGLACALGLPGYGQDLRRPGLGRAPVGFVDGWRPGMVVRFGAPFDPNDEYFAPFVDGSYLGQWNLENNLDLSELGITARIDANIRGAWDRGLTGAGVTIGIVDDGLEWDHPDLVDNYNAADSYDFGNDTPDPYPFRDNQYTDSGLGFPLVTSNGDNHGTVVAGVAAGVGGNGIGLTGAAPNAGIAGLRASFDPADELVQDQQLADATRYHSTGASPTIKIKNHSYGSPIAYDPFSKQMEALSESAAAGTIHVYAAGNEREKHGQAIPDAAGDPTAYIFDADSNKKDMQHSSSVITVGALRIDGNYAEYSDFGSNLFVTAPSSGVIEVDTGLGFAQGIGFGIISTDRVGGFDGDPETGGYNWTTDAIDLGFGEPLHPDSDSFGDLSYTTVFGGTSAAAPLVAGVIALGVEAARANGVDMDGRMAKHLLALSSNNSIDSGDVLTPANVFTTDATGGWMTNAAGYEFNNNYGFGLVDADRFTELAAQFGGVTPEVVRALGTTVVDAAIPDHDDSNPYLERVFSISDTIPLEEMEIGLKIAHTFRGQLEAFLISPLGTISRLFYRNGPVFAEDPFDPGGPLIQIGDGDAADDIDWTFLTNAFWGENPFGEWKIRLYDRFEGETGRWESFSARAHMGYLIGLTAVPEPSTLAMLGVGLGGLAAWRVRRRRPSQAL